MTTTTKKKLNIHFLYNWGYFENKSSEGKSLVGGMGSWELSESSSKHWLVYFLLFNNDST